MTRKNLARVTGITFVTLMMLFLFSVTVLAASNPLNVPFKAQVLPGNWAETKNCGQTSALMVFCYYDGTTPTEQGIKDIDDWLYARYGSAQAINGYSGSYSSTTTLETLAKERGGKYGGFPLSYKASGWTVSRVKQEIDAGHPVIVAVDGSYLGQKYGKHFLVVKGYTSTGIMTNDPGRTEGQLTYTNSQFASAMNAQGGAVVVVIPNPVPTIKINSPTHGTYWSQWTTHKIQWSYTGNPTGSVNIDLLKGTCVYRIKSNAPIGSGGIGSYSWLISQPKGQCRIRVTINSCGIGYTGTSSYFYIN